MRFHALSQFSMNAPSCSSIRVRQAAKAPLGSIPTPFALAGESTVTSPSMRKSLPPLSLAKLTKYVVEKENRGKETSPEVAGAVKSEETEDSLGSLFSITSPASFGSVTDASPSVSRSRTVSMSRELSFSCDFRHERGASFASKKSILKFDPDTAAQEARVKLAQIDKKNRAKWERVMRVGANLLVVMPNGKAKPKHFRVDVDDNLCWPAEYLSAYTESLCDLIKIDYGPVSSTFATCVAEIPKQKPWLCFSLYFRRELPVSIRVVDLICEDEPQLMTWYLGLQSMAPLVPARKSRGCLFWWRLKMKIIEVSKLRRCSAWTVIKACISPIMELQPNMH